MVSLLFCLVGSAHAVEWQGLVDLRAVSASGSPSWTDGGLGKQRVDRQHDGLRLGQAMLIGRGELLDEVTGTVVISADDQRKYALDFTEAYLSWKPIPSGSWRSKLKAGAFFPAMSLENDGPGWTTTRTLSSSAINSWIGEEFRTVGLEYTLARPGKFVDSPHDFSATVAVYKGNDPAGTLLAWSGWNIGDRITGLRETIPLADLPVYRDDGHIPKQDAEMDTFRELDGRFGYYTSLQYSYNNVLTLNAMNYNNRANPRVVNHGQYGWSTRFNHLGLRYAPSADWEVLAQFMDGKTSMGPRGVFINYDAWYVLAARHWQSDSLALRYDHFNTRQNDRLPQDNNDENGHGLAVAYTHQMDRQWQFKAEWLQVNSLRPARADIGQTPLARDNSLTLAVQWQF